MIDEQELLKKLQLAFKEEATERFLSIDGQLSVLELNRSPQEFQDALEIIFRDAHSLKGASRSVGLVTIEPFFQAAEDVFSGFKKKTVKFSADIIHLLQHSIEAVEQYLSSPENQTYTAQIHAYTKKIKVYLSENRIDALLPVTTEKMADIQFGNTVTTATVTTTTAAPAPANITSEPDWHNDTDDLSAKVIERSKLAAASFMRINKEKLDSLLQQSDELIMLKQLFPDNLEKIKDLQHDLLDTVQLSGSINTTLHAFRRQMETILSKYPETQSLTNLCRRIENNFENLCGRIDHMGEQINSMSSRLADDVRSSAKMVDGFRDKLKMIALMPFSSLTGTFPRMMREISAEIGHEFEFIITGSNIEIDRRVLDELRDPLIHLLRNAADHGIESKDRRAKSGKKTIGRVELSIGISADKKIEISVSDDGNGIDTGRIRCKLIDEMHMPESVVAEMTEDKIVNHIFDSGFTTSSIITTISGRGLGMAIVRDKIEALGGSIHIDNHPGAGVAFILSLPAALSSQRGILFCVSGRTFAMPTNGIEAFTRIKQSDIQTIKGIQSLTLYGKTLPVFDMAPILGLSSDFNSKEKITIILISLSGINAGFIVGNVLREREMLVKPLGSLMPSVSNVSGITVTSSGEVVPVLNSRDVLQNAMNSLGTTTPLRRSSDKVEKPTIMLAEDSITSRTLLANILEAAGYEVITAVDGEAAWQQLQRVKIDLLVSDIEMPRMDGFELTEKVRNFPRLTTLPIVLVTSLSKQEDRERGINLGANAYITKGDFSQSHLLDTVERLL